MRFYEAAMVLVPELDEERTQAAIDRVTEVITARGGKVGDIQKWGRRRLAYEIDRHREGIYVFIPFAAEPGVSAEVERVLRLSEDVIRHMVVRMEEEPAPRKEPEVEERDEAAAE